MSCSMAELEFQSPKKSNENGNDDDDDIAEDLVRIVSDDEEDEGGDGGEASEAPQKHHQLDLDENASMCSELSVGQEHALHHEIPPADAQEDEEILDVSDTHSNSSVDENNRTPSTPGETMSSLSPFTLASTLRFPVPFSLQAPTANVMTPGAPNANISPFQEEFLRKSHLYAEELMKHQMHLMAAARASAFSLRNQNLHPGIGGHPSHLVHINPLTKLGQISAAAAAAAALSAAAVQNSKTQGHGQQSQIISPHNAASHVLPPQQHHPHSHPHAHLQHHLPQSASTTSDTLAKLTALSKQTSPATSHMMSTLNQLQTQMQAHLPRLFNDNNDNLHERALKFSIDNILKGDFGRGQSPPATATSHSKKSLHFLSHANKQFLNIAKQKSHCSSSSSSAVSDTLDPQQHQHQQQQHHQHQSSANSTPAFSASLASICTNSNDSNSTAVSSSYSSANGTGDLIKSSPSQTPTLSPGLNETAGSGRAGGGGAVGKDDTGSATTAGAGTSGSSSGGTSGGNGGPIVWPAWVYCTRYSDRPSSGELGW
uniref:Uncharacterized protein n=1 Tax=Musca domestica TaxID=7370 RepID=A0A1I8MTG5_MUSDO